MIQNNLLNKLEKERSQNPTTWHYEIFIILINVKNNIHNANSSIQILFTFKVIN